MRLLFLFFIATTFYLADVQAQDSLKTYTTELVTDQVIRIDGLPDDEAWDLVPWGGGDFKQIQPDNGAQPTEQTYFKILYGAKHLYIIIRAEDSEPQKIVKRMSRRDGFDGDWVEVNIDSYYDKRTAFSFTASVSGVKGDEYVSNNGDNWDTSWDPIWDLATSIYEKGWYAEFRIPLSQLRFADKEEHVWGIQINRLFFRNSERSSWQFIPSDASGWVHLFAELKGIKGIKPQKQLEIQPYVVAKTERFEKQEGNPYATGKSSHAEFGLDAKIGITSDITLDLTVNPDFGQVEADPSQVNLSAFQLFFQERRPFFIEGNNILTFPITGWSNNNLFYSRRIGRQPQGYANPDENGPDNVNEYVKTKENSKILGAAKITGKNKDGFSFGILESVTALENATIDSLGHERKTPVEPLTNYLIARAQQDFKQGQTIVGGMITATNRDINVASLDHLHTSAYTAGLDAIHYWNDRSYFLSGKVLFSNVQGSEESITATQMRPERYFQRTDNNYRQLDLTRTSLNGTGGMAMFGKRSGQVTYEIGYTWNSPELELNDVGFLSQTDIMSQWAILSYRTLNPFSIFRNLRLQGVQWYDKDFGWNTLGHGYELIYNSEFKNFWILNTGVALNSESISNADLRGGPSITYPGNINYFIAAATDSRKKLRLVINPSWNWGFEGHKKSSGIATEVIYRPTNALNLSVNPGLNYYRHDLQYVATTESKDYIVARINQTTYNLSLRLTYMITPDLSIQYWGQPFASAGEYSEFKKITNSNAEHYADRFLLLDDFITYDSENALYSVDLDEDQTTDFSIQNPDFNITQFRSNMVVRWEYIPGSTFFLVWTQNRTEFPSNDSHSFDHLYSGLFDKKPHNIFLLKFTYRFVL